MTLNLSLAKIADIVAGKLIGKDRPVNHLCIDTRKLQPNDLFIALQGEQFDGHQFVNIAREKQAIGAIVSQALAENIPQIIVADTTAALGKLAAYHRQQFQIPMLAITGSCGKTTSRAMLTNIVSQVGSVLSSESSYNNAIGLPLTLLRLEQKHQFAVIEMGTNHFGELDYLTQIAKPSLAIITNVGPVHLEFLQDVAGVARAKGEIFSGLPAEGVGIIQADSEYEVYWRSLLRNKRCITFGWSERAAVTARDLQLDDAGHPSFTLVTEQGNIHIKSPLLGKHNVSNALACAAAALAIGIPLPAIKIGLETVIPVTKRLVEHVNNNVRLIDDTYNANPSSVSAAIDVLQATPGDQKILVLGKTGELGKNAEKFHEQIGVYAKKAGIDLLFACGDLTINTVNAFGSNGFHYATQQELTDAVKTKIKSGVTILVKGSRSATMEKVVQALLPMVER